MYLLPWLQIYFFVYFSLLHQERKQELSSILRPQQKKSLIYKKVWLWLFLNKLMKTGWKESTKVKREYSHCHMYRYRIITHARVQYEVVTDGDQRVVTSSNSSSSVCGGDNHHGKSFIHSFITDVHYYNSTY